MGLVLVGLVARGEPELESGWTMRPDGLAGLRRYLFPFSRKREILGMTCRYRTVANFLKQG